MKIILALACVVFVYAESGYALGGIGASYSKRLHEMEGNKDAKITADAINFALHVSPIPLVPISGGLTFTLAYYDDPDQALGKSKSDGMEVAVGGRAWLPLSSSLKPFVSLNYILWGTIVTEFENKEELMKYLEKLNIGSKNTARINKVLDKEPIYGVTGLVIGIGLSYELLPFITLTAEYNLGLRELSPYVDEDKKYKFTSADFGFGVQLGI